MARKLEKAALRALTTGTPSFRLSQIAAAQKARGPHLALTNALPTRTNIISRKRDVVVFRLVHRDGHAETGAFLVSDCGHRLRLERWNLRQEAGRAPRLDRLKLFQLGLLLEPNRLVNRSRRMGSNG